MRRPAIGDLVTLGWPLVPPWQDIDPNLQTLIDGRKVVFAPDDDRGSLVRFLAQSEPLAQAGKTYIVFVAHEDWRRGRERSFCTGWTAFAKGDSVVCFQSVVFETRFARSQGVCAGGVFFEIDAPNVSAWNGTELSTDDPILH